MTQIQIRVDKQAELLTLSAETQLLGTQYDNGAQRLVFTRPDGYGERRLLLYFSNEVAQFAPIDIGQDNEYSLTNALTQREKLWLQIAFRDGDRLEHSNRLMFSLRPSSEKGRAPVTPLPNPLLQLADGAFTGAGYGGGHLRFYNLEGTEVKRIALAVEGGGGSSIGYSPYIGADGHWWAWDDMAGTYADTGVAAAGRDGAPGPQGLPGATGATGAVGPQGPAGLTTSVNGVEQRDGAISITARDIPQSDPNLTSGNMQGAISELFSSVSDGKAAVVTDIEAQGGTVNRSGDIATFQELSEGVRSIPTGGVSYSNYFVTLRDGGTRSAENNTFYATENGISWVFSPESSLIYLSGTATASFALKICADAGRTYKFATLSSDTQYFFYTLEDTLLGTGVTLRQYCRYYNNGARFLIELPLFTQTEMSVRVSSTSYMEYSDLYIPAGTVFNQYTFGAMLVKGSTRLPWKAWNS